MINSIFRKCDFSGSTNGLNFKLRSYVKTIEIYFFVFSEKNTFKKSILRILRTASCAEDPSDDEYSYITCCYPSPHPSPYPFVSPKTTTHVFANVSDRLHLSRLWCTCRWSTSPEMQRTFACLTIITIGRPRWIFTATFLIFTKCLRAVDSGGSRPRPGRPWPTHPGDCMSTHLKYWPTLALSILVFD